MREGCRCSSRTASCTTWPSTCGPPACSGSASSSLSSSEWSPLSLLNSKPLSLSHLSKSPLHILPLHPLSLSSCILYGNLYFSQLAPTASTTELPDHPRTQAFGQNGTREKRYPPSLLFYLSSPLLTSPLLTSSHLSSPHGSLLLFLLFF